MNIIIITGASSGMGREFALQLDSLFDSVDEIWLLARRRTELEKVADCMSHSTRIIDIDITNKTEMNSFMELLVSEKPIIRMLVNCAGFGLMGSFQKLDIEAQLGMIELNDIALTRMTYMCIPYMRKNSRIIQLASSAAFMPQPFFAIYAASKAYVHSFSRALAEELRKQDIYVTSVCPGPVDTAFFDIAEKYGKTLAIKKLAMAKPEKVVEKAISDSHKKKEVSVYGGLIVGLQIISKILPHKLMLIIMRLGNITRKA